MSVRCLRERARERARAREREIVGEQESERARERESERARNRESERARASERERVYSRRDCEVTQASALCGQAALKLHKLHQLGTTLQERESDVDCYSSQ